MDSSSLKSNHPNWLKIIILALSLVLTVGAFIVLLGWATRSDVLIHDPTGIPSIKANSALGYFLIGLALLSAKTGRYSWLRNLSLIAAMLGGLSILEIIFSLNLRIDEFFLKDHLTVGDAGIPGRMTLVAALCLTLGGLLTSPICSKNSPRQLLIMALGGSSMLAAGLAAITGYVFDLPAVYNWGHSGTISPIGACFVLCIGTIILLWSWTRHRQENRDAPTWLPLPIMVAFLGVTLIFWIGLRERENLYIASATQNAITNLASTINLSFEKQVAQIERLCRSWSKSSRLTPVLREADYVTFFNEKQGLKSISLVDPTGNTVWFAPQQNNENLIGFDNFTDPIRRDAILKANNDHFYSASPSPSLNIRGAGLGFLITCELQQDSNTPSQYVVAEYPYRDFLDSLIAKENDYGDFLYKIDVGGTTVYSSPQFSNARSLAQSFTIQNRRFRIEMAPSQAKIHQNERHLPELALAAGIGITFLLGLSVHLARFAFSGMRSTENYNQQLRNEIDERRRIETQLKLSDERLRLALESTQIGIVEWLFEDDRFYISSAFWKLLGYDSEKIDPSSSFWLSMVHSDDQIQVNQEHRRLMRGDIDFLEVEYRVRSAYNQWKWVYVRGRAVARATNGYILRMLGTIQDVSERRAAEMALQASQASTRKLSLVASQTDNLVIIGDQRNSIEWVNESVERTLGREPKNLIGLSLDEFLCTDETPEETRRLIRRAILRGESISCDIVLLGAQERRYDLHIELQTARNENGRVENIIVVGTDITTRVNTEAELRRAKVEADNASRAKSDFLASMSHEIRTPMNGVIGMTSLLLDTKLTLDQRDYVNTIRTSGETLLTIINDILDFSKIESGHMDLDVHPFDLSSCIEETIDLFGAQALARNLEIAYFIDEKIPAVVLGDVTRFRQVVSNLFSNAIKFTHAGAITITAHPGEDEDMVTFTIADTGIGIPPDRLNRLFKPFSQVDSSTTRKYGGTGLGLVICARLCQLMGGSIHVESEAGIGSRFIFSIRLSAASSINIGETDPALSSPILKNKTVLLIGDHALNRQRYAQIVKQHAGNALLTEDISSAEKIILSQKIKPSILIIDSTLPKSSTFREKMTLEGIRQICLIPTNTGSVSPINQSAILTKPARNQQLHRAIIQLSNISANTSTHTMSEDSEKPKALLADTHPFNILLVEDNPVNQKVALRFLERLGYRADCVANGLEALSSLRLRRYDLVFMDLQMPEMDGITAAREIRKEFPPEQQPIIVALTANALEGDREACLAAGMNDYLNKPIKMTDLATVIQKHHPTASA